MALEVASDTVTLGALFAPGQRLVMPPFQRSYSWTDAEALDLLEDFREAAAAGVQHYVGAIVLVGKGPNGPHEIVDGQQRLTTLTLLLAVLRDLDPGTPHARRIQALIADQSRSLLRKAPVFRLTLNHLDRDFFRQRIQKRGRTADLDGEEAGNESQRRFIVNAGVLAKRLGELTLAERAALAGTLIDGCAITRVDVGDRELGYKVFRVLNTRGRQPNAHDIIKTELFEAARLSHAEADKYSRRWLDYEAQLGSKPFDDLLQQIRTLANPGARGTLIGVFRKAVIEKGQPRDFLETKLPRYVDAFQALARSRVSLGPDSPAVNAALDRLRAVDHNVWRAVALKYLVERAPNAPAGEPARFFDGLERLGYVCQICIHKREVRARRYRAVADAIDGASGAGALIDMDKGPLAISAAEAGRMRTRLTERFSSHNQRRAMALRVNGILEGGQTLPPEADATVEHVLPQSPEAGSHWMSVWPDPGQRRSLGDTLGNLVLLSHTDNQRAARMSFQEKKRIYFEGGRADYALTRDLEGIESWTPDTVRRRTADLADILVKAWNLDD